MLSTIFTDPASGLTGPHSPAVSTPCQAGVAVAFLACSLPVSAAEFPQGCFARLYDPAHLESAPAQSVVQMTVLAERYPTELLDGWLEVQVMFRGEGIGAQNVIPGLRYSQRLFCREDGGPPRPGWARGRGMTCFAECDGGAMQIAAWDGSTLDLRTGGLHVQQVGGECEGNAFLAPEGRESVVFRLFPADQTLCASQ